MYAVYYDSNCEGMREDDKRAQAIWRKASCSKFYPVPLSITMGSLSDIPASRRNSCGWEKLLHKPLVTCAYCPILQTSPCSKLWVSFSALRLLWAQGICKTRVRYSGLYGNSKLPLQLTAERVVDRILSIINNALLMWWAGIPGIPPPLSSILYETWNTPRQLQTAKAGCHFKIKTYLMSLKRRKQTLWLWSSRSSLQLIYNSTCVRSISISNLQHRKWNQSNESTKLDPSFNQLSLNSKLDTILLECCNTTRQSVW